MRRSRAVADRWPLAGWLALLACLALVSGALAYAPEQATAGAVVFTDRCSTCHGDVGQGLTDEFRATWPEGHQNCWVPGCHGGNPPKPNGFTIPRSVAALAGPGTLVKFSTASALHGFIRAAMPYQEPGVLTDEQYWALTAYLLRQNGVPPDGRTLDASNADSVAVPRTGQPVPVPPRTPSAAKPSMLARDRAPRIALTATPAPTLPAALTAAIAIAALQGPATPVAPVAVALPAVESTAAPSPFVRWWPAAVVLVALAGLLGWWWAARRRSRG
jgi:mono/diheme cytochrome c family protein